MKACDQRAALFLFAAAAMGIGSLVFFLWRSGRSSLLPTGVDAPLDPGIPGIGPISDLSRSDLSREEVVSPSTLSSPGAWVRGTVLIGDGPGDLEAPLGTGVLSALLRRAREDHGTYVEAGIVDGHWSLAGEDVEAIESILTTAIEVEGRRAVPIFPDELVPVRGETRIEAVWSSQRTVHVLDADTGQPLGNLLAFRSPWEPLRGSFGLPNSEAPGAPLAGSTSPLLVENEWGSLWITSPGYVWRRLDSSPFLSAETTLRLSASGAIRLEVDCDGEAGLLARLYRHRSFLPSDLTSEVALRGERTTSFEKIDGGEYLVSLHNASTEELIDQEDFRVLPGIQNDIGLDCTSDPALVATEVLGRIVFAGAFDADLFEAAVLRPVGGAAMLGDERPTRVSRASLFEIRDERGPCFGFRWQLKPGRYDLAVEPLGHRALLVVRGTPLDHEFVVRGIQSRRLHVRDAATGAPLDQGSVHWVFLGEGGGSDPPFSGSFQGSALTGAPIQLSAPVGTMVLRIGGDLYGRSTHELEIGPSDSDLHVLVERVATLQLEVRDGEGQTVGLDADWLRRVVLVRAQEATAVPFRARITGSGDEKAYLLHAPVEGAFHVLAPPIAGRAIEPARCDLSPGSATRLVLVSR